MHFSHATQQIVLLQEKRSFPLNRIINRERKFRCGVSFHTPVLSVSVAANTGCDSRYLTGICSQHRTIMEVALHAAADPLTPKT